MNSTEMIDRDALVGAKVGATGVAGRFSVAKVAKHRGKAMPIATMSRAMIATGVFEFVILSQDLTLISK